MTKLHDELGLHTLTTITTITTITITSEVIIEVPGRVVVVVGGPGRLQPVQVVDEGLHDLRLDQLPAWGLNRGRVPLPHSAGATHTRTEGLHIIILVVEEVIVVVVVVVPHHLDLRVQVVPEVSIDTVCLPALAHFFTGEKNRTLPSWFV